MGFAVQQFNQTVYCISVYTLNHFKISSFTVLNMPNNCVLVETLLSYDFI